MDFIKQNPGVVMTAFLAILSWAGNVVWFVVAFYRLRDRVDNNENACSACKESVMQQIEQIKQESREDFAEMKAITGKLSDAVNSLSNVVARLEILAELSVKHQ